VSYLIDTDICSAHLKQRGAVTSRFLQYSGRLHISVITLGELMTWARRASAPAQRLRGVEDLVSDVVVLEVTKDVAVEFAGWPRQPLRLSG